MIKRVSILIVTLLLSSLGSVAYADNSAQAKADYLKQVYKKLHSEWRIIKAKKGWTCEVYILQDRDGNVLESNVSKCNTTDKRFINQTKKAVKLASPLPRASDEVFTSELTLYLKIKDNIDVMRSVKKRQRDGDPAALKLSKDFRNGIERWAREGDPISMKIAKDIEQYEEGWKASVAGDAKTAFSKWLPLAEDNYKSSQFNLGVMYSAGKGVEKDLSKAFYWYERAAKSGHTKSQYGIAWMYHNGVGVEKDISKAVFWYKEAAEYEDKAAMFALGVMYYNGSNGLKKDKVKALELIRGSANQGYSKAIVFLDKYEL